MSSFDDKEKRMLERYKKLLEGMRFDEYDIHSFLIFIRDHLKKDGTYLYIREFCDLIAHRHRSKGNVMSCITNAIDNSHMTKPGSREIQGYQGMDFAKWKKEWKELYSEFGIKYTNALLEDVTLCVFSLVQFSEYDDGKGHSGRIELCQGSGGEIGILTTEGQRDSSKICFAKFGNYTFCKEYMCGLITQPVVTCRENGILRLKDETDYII